MSALEELRHRFSERQRSRGDAYFRDDRFDLVGVSASSVEAFVYGQDVYGVRVQLKGRRWSMSCTCPAFDNDAACKHTWAVLLAYQQALSTSAIAPQARNTTDSKSKPVARARPSELDRQLRALEPVPAAPRYDGEIELQYVLHSLSRGPEEWSALQFRVGRSHRGRVRTYRSAFPAAIDQQSLPEDEQRMLAMLAGDDWSWRTADLGPGSREIPKVLEATVLEIAARSGRLFLGEEQNVGKIALGFDAGQPWILALTLRRDGTQVVLSGHLARGGERLDLARCQRVLVGGVIVSANRLALADWRGAWAWVPTLRRAGEIRAPAEQAHRLLSALRSVPGNPAVEAAEFVEDLPRIPSGIVQVTAALGADGALPARVLFRYGELRCDSTDPSRTTWTQRGDRLFRLVRDDDLEAALTAQFTAAGGRIGVGGELDGAQSIPLETLPELVRDLTARGWIVEADGARLRVGASMRTEVSSGIDWFDVGATMDFDGLSPDMPELLRAVQQRSNLVRLSDGSVGLLPEAWLQRWRIAATLGQVHEDKLRVPASRAWLLDAWLAENEDAIDIDAAFTRIREGLRNCADPKERPEPRGFQGELRPYQREGLGWMHFLSEAAVGGILADDMGLGKTVQVLALLLERRAKARGPALVVAPLSVLFNWERETERFTPGLACVLHHGTRRARKAALLEDADLVVTSYGTLRADVALLKSLQFDCAVLDEAQAIKNDKSQSAKAARLLNADLKLALSGTPIENHLGELASILRYTNPALMEGSRALTSVLSGPGGDSATARLVAHAVRPFLLRRTKEQVARELPPKSEQVVSVELEGSERRAYDELRKRIAADVLEMEAELGLEQIGLHVLEALLRLRQAACHPGLLDPSRVGESSAKLDTLVERLEEIVESGHKALVFSQFTSFLAIVRARLDARGMRYEYLDGKTRKREERVRAFQEQADIPLFLISLKAGGAGLNLTAADYVFLLDPWWNPAVEAQAIDRTHRIGQTRPVTAYRLIARDTIEEKVRALQERKRALADALFEGVGTSLRDLTRADLQWLLE
jgi:superfamily II DNA or RNA helicase